MICTGDAGVCVSANSDKRQPKGINLYLREVGHCFHGYNQLVMCYKGPGLVVL